MSNPLHGFKENMPNEDYHRSEGVSKTGLDKIERSPAHYRYPPKSKPSTRNMEIGTAIHAAVLEPERFDAEYFMADADKRTEKAYKDAAKINSGELTLTRGEADNVLGMREAVHSNVDAMQYLSRSGKAELSAFCTDPETGVQIRARFDWLTDCGIAVDLKKTQDLRKFGRSVSDYRYHVQDAMYSFIYKQITGEDLRFLFLAVEEESPHSNHIFELEPIGKEIGEYYFRRDLKIYADCMAKDNWPHAKLETGLLIPNWEISRYEDSLEVEI